MAYLLFKKELEDEAGSFYKLVENDDALSGINHNLDSLKKITINAATFKNVNLGKKFPKSFKGDTVTYDDLSYSLDKSTVENQIKIIVGQIDDFLKSNSGHAQYDKWNNYKTQLNSLNLDDLTYPLETTLEEYFDDNSQTALSSLQLP